MSLSVLLVVFSLFDTSLNRYRSKRGLRFPIEADDPRLLETTRTITNLLFSPSTITRIIVNMTPIIVGIYSQSTLNVSKETLSNNNQKFSGSGHGLNRDSFGWSLQVRIEPLFDSWLTHVWWGYIGYTGSCCWKKTLSNIVNISTGLESLEAWFDLLL